MLAVVDAGQLYATIDSDDSDHQRSRAALEPPGLRLVIPALVMTEELHFIGQRLSPSVEARSLAGLGMLNVEAPLSEDWTRIAELVSTYRNFPLGGTDASVVVLAERLNTDLIITLDHRHFAAIRPRHPPASSLSNVSVAYCYRSIDQDSSSHKTWLTRSSAVMVFSKANNRRSNSP